MRIKAMHTIRMIIIGALLAGLILTRRILRQDIAGIVIRIIGLGKMKCKEDCRRDSGKRIVVEMAKAINAHWKSCPNLSGDNDRMCNHSFDCDQNCEYMKSFVKSLEKIKVNQGKDKSIKKVLEDIENKAIESLYTNMYDWQRRDLSKEDLFEYAEEMRKCLDKIFDLAIDERIK